MGETKWGQTPRNPNAQWVKVREVVGAPFTLLRCNEGRINGKPSYICEISGDRLFSVSKDTSAIGKMIGRYGLPPAGEYEIVANANKVTPSAANPLGNQYILRAL